MKRNVDAGSGPRVIRAHAQTALDKWQVQEITGSLAEADRDEFASDSDVKQVLKKWTGRFRWIRRSMC